MIRKESNDGDSLKFHANFPPSLTRAKPGFICASFRVLNSTSIARPTISR